MQSGTAAPGPTTTGQALVLVCDDTEPIRRLVRINLELAGFAVEEATDGHEAMARLIDPELPVPAVVVIDSQMSPYDGWWAIAAIRSHHRLDEMPVLLVTANVAEHVGPETTVAGFDGVVGKPFDPDELVTAVSRLADGGRATHSGQ
jgi:CheY-like chemotaxis protein